MGMETVTEHIKGDRKDVLKCGIIAAEVALGQQQGCCALIPVVVSEIGVCGFVLGMDMNRIPEDIQDLAIALAIKLGMAPEMAENLRPARKTDVEVSYTFV
jgi:hypothetical protein